jgi:hypothetical protein
MSMTRSWENEVRCQSFEVAVDGIHYDIIVVEEIHV